MVARSFKAIIDLWPDRAALARDLGRPYFTVSAWRHRNSIPQRHWDDLVACAGRMGVRGVTYAAFRVAAARALRDETCSTVPSGAGGNPRSEATLNTPETVAQDAQPNDKKIPFKSVNPKSMKAAPPCL